MNPACWIWRGPEPILQPLLFCALLTVGFGLCLYLFVTLKAELRRHERGRAEDRRQVAELKGALGKASTALARLEKDLREVEQQTGMLVPPVPARSGLNLSKRTQVLRLHRAGEDPTMIAASLGLPRGEVDLLIKVQHMLMKQM